jgi:hypothetical protein
VASSVDKAHGRLERRTLRLTATLTKHQDWSGLAQGFELVRERTIKGATTVEVVHGITSLHQQEAAARKLLGLVRGHWGIENKVHYVRDVTLGEDGSRVRKGAAPQVLAAVRNAVIHLLAGVDATSNAAAIRRLNNRPEEALALLGLPRVKRRIALELSHQWDFPHVLPSVARRIDARLDEKWRRT